MPPRYWQRPLLEESEIDAIMVGLTQLTELPFSAFTDYLSLCLTSSQTGGATNLR